MSVEQFYKDLIYRHYRPVDGYINYRKISEKNTTNEFTKDIDTFIKAVSGKTDVFHGMSIRKKKNGKATNCLYASCLFMDIDFHTYPTSSHEVLKNKAISVIANDPYLSQASAIVDSGRGLHLYYLLPEKTYVDTLKNYMNRLITYAENVYFINDENILDRRVKDVARILRVPGSINSKTGNAAEILFMDPVPIDEHFVKYLKATFDPGKRSSSFSVIEAMELVGYKPTDTHNVSCPFPGHDDNSPSFRYYPDSDTFWCFKCSEEKKYFDGIHFLTLMDRTDLIPKLRASSVVAAIDNHTLDDSGRLWKKTQNGDKLVADFLSSQKIEVKSVTHGRRVYIDLDDSVVELTDYPTNRELKKRYLQTHREFLLAGSEAGFADMLSRFIMKAAPIDKKVIFNHGLNQYQNSKPVFYINSKALPKQENEPVAAVEDFYTQRPFKRYDIDFFLENLRGDGNTTHIIGFLWGIASLARDIFISRAGMFPMLVATGTHETGKTLLARMVTSMFGYDRDEELDTTAFAMIKKLERYGTMPIHFDEFGNKKREVEHEELLKDLATSVMSIRERGNVSQKTDRYVMQCPIIITGEKNIVDAGIVSRSIILNLGKSAKKNYACFVNWIDFVRDGRLLSFFTDFINNHLYSFRDFIKHAEITRERSKVKEDILSLTMDYLDEYVKEISHDFNRTAIAAKVQDTKIYQDSISSDGYTEILSEVLSDNFDPDNTPARSYKLAQLMDSFFFYIPDGYIILNLSALYDVYKVCVKDSYRRIPSISDFKVNFLQSPDMIGFIKNRKRLFIDDRYTESKKEKRLHNTIVLKVSEHNFDYMRLVMLYKYLPDYENDIQELYDKVDYTLDDMNKKVKKFVDKQGSYTVI